MFPLHKTPIPETGSPQEQTGGIRSGCDDRELAMGRSNISGTDQGTAKVIFELISALHNDIFPNNSAETKDIWRRNRDERCVVECTTEQTGCGVLALQKTSCVYISREEYEKKTREIEELQRECKTLKETCKNKMERIVELEEKCTKLEIQLMTNNSQSQTFEQQQLLPERTERCNKRSHHFEDLNQANTVITELKKDMQEQRQCNCISESHKRRLEGKVRQLERLLNKK